MNWDAIMGGLVVILLIESFCAPIANIVRAWRRK